MAEGEEKQETRLRKVASHRGAEGAWDYFKTDEEQSRYIDGFHRVALGPLVSRVDCFEIIDPGSTGSVEHRRHEFTLVMPTKVLVEFCSNLVLTMRSNKESWEKSVDEEVAKTIAALERST